MTIADRVLQVDKSIAAIWQTEERIPYSMNPAGRYLNQPEQVPDSTWIASSPS